MGKVQGMAQLKMDLKTAKETDQLNRIQNEKDCDAVKPKMKQKNEKQNTIYKKCKSLESWIKKCGLSVENKIYFKQCLAGLESFIDGIDTDEDDN